MERLEEGTQLPHVLEHVALELQTLAGSDVSFGRVVASGDPGVWWVIVAYEEEDVGVQSRARAGELVRACIAGQPFDVDAIGRRAARAVRKRAAGPVHRARSWRRRGAAASRCGGSTRDSLVQLGLGRNLRRIQAAMTDCTSAIAVEIAQDKDDTRARARQHRPPRAPRRRGAPRWSERAGAGGRDRLPGPDQAARRQPRPRHLGAARRQGRPARRLAREAARVRRGAWWSSGSSRGATIACWWWTGAWSRVRRARPRARGRRRARRPCASWSEKANRDPRRGRSGHTQHPHAAAGRRGERGATCARAAARWTTVPAAGEAVCLRATANLSTGGTSIDRTDEIHPDNVTACEMAAGDRGARHRRDRRAHRPTSRCPSARTGR